MRLTSHGQAATDSMLSRADYDVCPDQHVIADDDPAEGSAYLNIRIYGAIISDLHKPFVVREQLQVIHRHEVVSDHDASVSANRSRDRQSQAAAALPEETARNTTVQQSGNVSRIYT
jgi:hypothetical protein